MAAHLAAVLCVGLVISAVGTGALGAQQAPPPAPPPAPGTGILAGIIRDEQSLPVPDAEIAIEGTALSTRSGGNGRFQLEGVPAGIRELVVEKIGYRVVRAQITVLADSGMVLAITLIAEGQQLPGVIVDADVSNRLVGMVVDDKEQPLVGVEVELLGLQRVVTTGEDGRFVFLDVRPGDWLMQVRKKGYGIQQRGVRMLPGLTRDMAVRMRRGENPRMRTEVAAIVAQEATRRQGMRGARAVVVGRDELEPWGNQPVGVALLGSSGAVAFRETGGSCVLVDGHEVMRDGAPTSPQRVQIRGRGGAPVSINPAGTGGSNPPIPRGPAPGSGTATIGNWLSFFRASDVEMIEIFPEGTENSRTLCGRFPPSSGCSCPPEPAGVVLWLKK